MDDVVATGYDGVEFGISSDTEDAILERMWNLAERYKLKILPQHFDTKTVIFNEHHDQYGHWLERISGYPAEKINSQTGRDIFSMEDNLKLISLAGNGRYMNCTAEV